MVPTLLSLLASEAALTLTCGATSEDKVGIMITLGFGDRLKVSELLLGLNKSLLSLAKFLIESV